ncbi:MBL fold metallo-hydrolase [Amnibacterium kyonggiense]|uniref:Glyoxylase-like metal-dependent hydrolase (Beta-lactamase superfamily II) n=1 Tax=Amnibacterium kyonggiense TaxID=595671 RepID=A0A4R7FLL8_9MICO|nr:MBL fold metallo-hydrolase [Amnibacterium kyonggiense]TDS77269.1 glyoxylase-like metal-dependent hydrolase (beta-lactamase superfamily II) [Amnibacterium kyonggiense]
MLRQGASTHFEAPFLFLLLGRERALLLDTGATADPEVLPLRATIDHLLATWVERNGVEGSYPLVVAHSHAHDDHVAGDGQFADRSDTTVLGHDAAAVAGFFGFDDGRAAFELGGRTLEVLATPGHEAAAITVFDPMTGWLLTGDIVYPGRLYIEDDVAFARSLDVLVEFARTRPVTAVLGCHVEMSTATGVDFPAGTIEQPDELPLALAPERLEAIRGAAHQAIGRPGRHVLDDVVLVNRV